MKKALVEKVLNKKQIEVVVADEKLSKSAKVRALFDGGLEVKDISEALNIRYNFAFNVLQNHIIMNDIEVEKTERNSKRDSIAQLLKDGKSLADVSRATKTNYNYIWKISKELKDSGELTTTNTTTNTTTTHKTPKAKNGPLEVRQMSEDEKVKYGMAQ